MIIVDSALKLRQSSNNPVRVAMIGAGFMGRGIALQILKSVPGMDLVGIANRHLDGAARAYREAGLDEVTTVESVAAAEKEISRGGHVITQDAGILCKADGIDAVIEVTGTIDYACGLVLTAIEHGKHVIAMNAELDGTLGPILNHYAKTAGVVFTNADGDQPGVTMNLYRFVKGLGVEPVLCGNIKGLQDPYRNPTTQAGFAKRWKQQPHMVTSFADGTKVSFEQAIIANATGMRVAKRGMLGPTVESGTPLAQAINDFPLAELEVGNGIVDYVVGAEPGPGVFVLGAHDDPVQQHYLALYKLGEGPLYCFYTPYHLCHLEVPNTVARAVLFGDAAIASIDGPRVDVVTTAKIDLKSGATLDGMGYYMTYGQCENSAAANRERLLPMGLAEGCILKRDIVRDACITYDDVIVPEGRQSDALRAQQNARFASSLSPSSQLE